MVSFVHFDIKTILVSETVVCLLFALVMYLMVRHYRTVDGLWQISLYFLGTGAGISVFLLRDFFVHKLDVPLSNAFYCSSLVLLYVGICALLHARPKLRWPILISIVFTLALTFVHGPGQTALRLEIITCADLLLRSYLLAVLLLHLRRGAAVKLLAAFTAFFIAFDAARLVGTFLYGLPQDAFQYNTIQSAYMAASLLNNCGLGIFSLALAAREIITLVERTARQDPLTGVLNRLGVEDRLTLELERVQQTGASLSVAVLDIDDFKIFNDKGGHALGDDVLRQIAGCILNNLRPCDACGRMGGDEFLILLPGSNAQDSGIVCHRIRDAIVSLPPYPSVGAAPTISLGHTEVHSSDTMEDVLARADRALYAAKRAGKNQVHLELFQPAL